MTTTTPTFIEFMDFYLSDMRDNLTFDLDRVDLDAIYEYVDSAYYGDFTMEDISMIVMGMSKITVDMLNDWFNEEYTDIAECTSALEEYSPIVIEMNDYILFYEF